MNSRAILLVINLIFSLETYSAEAAPKIDISFDSYNYSQAKYFNDYIGSFLGILKKGNHAVSLNKLSFDVNYNRLNFGLFKRLDYLHSFSSDTATLQHNIKNNLTPNLPKTYQLNLRMEHLEASGIKLGYQWQLQQNIVFSVTGNYFLGVNFHSGELLGHAEWSSAEDLKIFAPSVIYSAKNELLRHPKTDSSGKGYSFDLEFKWQPNDLWRVEFQANDAISQISWKKALVNQINRWKKHQTDSTGRLDTTPVLEGRVLEHEQKLIQGYKGTINFTKDNGYEYFSTLLHTEFFSHHHLGVKKHLENNKTLILAWHRNTNALEIGLNTPLADIKFTTDSISSKKRHVFNLIMGMSYVF